MQRTEALALEPNTIVRDTKYGLVGLFTRVTQYDEVEVGHEYDGGGFDYWPLDTLELAPTTAPAQSPAGDEEYIIRALAGPCGEMNPRESHAVFLNDSMGATGTPAYCVAIIDALRAGLSWSAALENAAPRATRVVVDPDNPGHEAEVDAT